MALGQAAPSGAGRRHIHLNANRDQDVVLIDPLPHVHGEWSFRALPLLQIWLSARRGREIGEVNREFGHKLKQVRQQMLNFLLDNRFPCSGIE